MMIDPNLFSTKSAIFAKYEFEKFRNNKNIRFNYKYHTHDAALKYMYVINRVERFLQTRPNAKVLDMGCGDGSMLHILSKSFGISGVGFDPILKSKRMRLNNLRIHGYSRSINLMALNHLDFMRKTKDKFDIVIDLCAVTHFDTKCLKKINNSWDFIGSNLKNWVNPGGIFISATDVSVYDKNCEFLFAGNILEFMSNFGIISNKNTILTKSDLFESKTIFQDRNIFQRVGKSGQKDIILGVLGFELKVTP
jgi:cyclopropane fatty-acyl-phospholipid synthase-like methyltransferase